MANPLGNLEGLRKMALDISFKSFGVPVTILPGGPYTKRRQIKGLWIREYTETEPGGLNVSSDVPDRRLAVKRSEAGEINRQTRLVTSDGMSGRIRAFRVDAPVEIFPDHFRLTLVPDDEITP